MYVLQLLNEGSVGFHETGNHCCKKISLAMALRRQATYHHSPSSNHALFITKSAIMIKKNSVSINQHSVILPRM